jgi:hypothetical protein
MYYSRGTTKLGKFFSLSFKMKLLIISAFFVSGIMRGLILIVPFKKLVSIMGEERLESPSDISSFKMSRAFKVSWAVNTACNHTPWESKCYVRALTAHFFLKILRIPSTIYLGVARDKVKNLIAHAWLRCGKEIIIGKDEMDLFTCITFYTAKFDS